MELTSKQAEHLAVLPYRQLSPHLENCLLNPPSPSLTRQLHCRLIAIKQIAARVKLPGVQWNQENVPQVLAHRCAYLNGLIGLSLPTN